VTDIRQMNDSESVFLTVVSREGCWEEEHGGRSNTMQGPGRSRNLFRPRPPARSSAARCARLGATRSRVSGERSPCEMSRGKISLDAICERRRAAISLKSWARIPTSSRRLQMGSSTRASESPLRIAIVSRLATASHSVTHVAGGDAVAARIAAVSRLATVGKSITPQITAAAVCGRLSSCYSFTLRIAVVSRLATVPCAQGTESATLSPPDHLEKL
jgi:hypothetical protein